MPITLEEISYDLDLSDKLSGIPRSEISAIKNEIKAELLNAILGDVAISKSPVDGSRFEKLSKEYKTIKKKKTGRSIADLRLMSNMLNALRVTNSELGVQVSIKQSKQIKKAYNHNVGDTVPKRQFIPQDGQLFRPGIMRKINSIIESAKDGS